MARLPLVAIMSAFNEEDIIGAAVEHLVRQGAALYLLDDGSTDRTVEIARAAAGDRLVGLEALAGTEGGPPATFRWSRILTRKTELAATIDADWFIHQDADEFRESPWPHVTLAEALALVGRLGWNAVDFEVFNFAPSGDSYRPGDDISQAFTRFSPAEPFDRVQVRCWRRQDAPVDLVSTGGHEAQFPGRRVFPIRFPMRHYPVRTVEQGERKIFRERKGRFDPEELARGWHVQYDRFMEGQPVVPDASSLPSYDADAANVTLQLKSRLIEDACPSLDSSFPADAGAYVRSVEADIVRQTDHVRALTEALEASRQEVAALLARRNELERWLESALAHAASLETEVQSAHEQTDQVNRNALDLARRLDDVFASRSWRVTRPLRAAWRLLGGR